MWKRIVAVILAIAMPGAASAGPLKAAAEKAGREIALAQADSPNTNRTRFWTGLGLIVSGGVLAALGTMELGDDENGPDDGEDTDESDDGEDSDGWGNKALLGGGIAAATVGCVLLLTGRKSGPVISARPDRIVIRQKIRF